MNYVKDVYAVIVRGNRNYDCRKWHLYPINMISAEFEGLAKRIWDWLPVSCWLLVKTCQCMLLVLMRHPVLTQKNIAPKFQNNLTLLTMNCAGIVYELYTLIDKFNQHLLLIVAWYIHENLSRQHLLHCFIELRLCGCVSVSQLLIWLALVSNFPLKFH